jgi:hypothetical protein
MADKPKEEVKKPAVVQPKKSTAEEKKQAEEQFKKDNPVAGGPDVGQTPASDRGMSHS